MPDETNQSHENEHAEPDRVLGVMIDMLNSRKEPVDAGIWVALTVRGTLVSGEIIPHWQWFDEQTEQYGEESHVAYFASVMKQSRDEHVVLLEKDESELTAADRDELDRRPAFVHLRHARSFIPQPVPRGGHYWRGRLEDVSGWSFGKLRGEDEPASV